MTGPSHSATAVAHPNIALVKYWGKRDPATNVPAVGSLSVTLAGLSTRTTVSLAPDSTEDVFRLNGAIAPAMAGRAFACVDRCWPAGRPRVPIRIDTRNDFPTAAGLASSASGFAALVTALDALLGGGLSATALARQAGRASGSAARSLFGGVVRLDAPARGSDDITVGSLCGAAEFPLEVLVAVTDRGEKAVGSTEAMLATERTSPYYRAWVETHAADLDAAAAAVAARDFAALAAVSERSCMKMHAVMMAASPALIYWNAATVAGIHRIRALRATGLGVFVTIDAGPQLKAVCLPEDADAVASALVEIPGVIELLRSGLGDGASVIERTPAGA